MNRRQFSKTLLSTLVGWSLMDFLALPGLLASPLRGKHDAFIRTLHERSLDLRELRISQRDWQEAIETLLSDVPLEDFLKAIDFEQLKAGFPYADLGVATRPVPLDLPEGLERTSFFWKLFGVQQGRAIIPHGHANMASAHVVLDGQFDLRHYDLVEKEKEHLIMQPTIHKQSGRGEVSSISDEHNNIHWFKTLSAHAFTLDVIMTNLNGQPYDIYNIDPYEAEYTDEGLLRAPILDVETALKKYGKEMHH